MCMPSAEAAKELATILAGKFPFLMGSDFAVTPAIVSSTRVTPVNGSSNRKSVVVTTRAWPSMPNATPRGGFPIVNVCLPLVVRSMMVSALLGVFGDTKLPKCAITRYLPSGDSATEPGCGATLIDVCIELSARDITSILLAVKLAMYSTPRASSKARSAAFPPMATTFPNVAPWIEEIGRAHV